MHYLQAYSHVLWAKNFVLYLVWLPTLSIQFSPASQPMLVNACFCICELYVHTLW